MEHLLKEANYVLRYEKGNFRPGYCILSEKRVVVVNRFLSTEARIHCLVDLIPLLNIEENQLSDGSEKIYRQILEPQPAE